MKKLFALLVFSVIFSLGINAQKEISGTIVDDEGLALIGANIIVKETTIGTITDIDGSYTLNVPDGSQFVVISFTGYETKELDISNGTKFDLVLQPNSRLIDEVVIVGYTAEKRIEKVGSISSISSEQIANRPTPNAVDALQGQIPGLLTTSNSGQPGASQAVRVRGTGSITAGRDPLYVIDGVIVNSGSVSQSDNSDNASDVLSLINPNDIESMTVLKDASATALYGSRGANGVVVINTKRGASGKTKITLKSQYGTTQPLFGKFDLMTGQQAWDYEREVLANGGFSLEQLNATRDSSMLDNTFNWLDAAFGTGSTYNVELQASGGDEKTRFFISGGYNTIEGTQIFSDFDRLSLRANIDHVASDKLTIGLNFNSSYATQANAVNGNRFQSPIASSFTSTPLQGAINPETGEFYTGLEADYLGLTNDNFLYSLPLNPVDISTFRMITKVFADYNILPNLKFSQTANVDWVTDNGLDYDAPLTNDGQDTNGALTNTFTNQRTLTSTSLLKYFKTFGTDHNFDALGGFEYQRFNSKGFFADGIGFASADLRTLDSAAEPQTVGGSNTNWSFLSYLGQINYDYANKYFVTLSARRDGSSRFGANNKWANFGSVGVGWSISEESFFPKNDVVSDLAFKASYGTAGNAAIGNFSSQELYGFGAAYRGNPGSSPSQISNPDLTWETSDQFDIGMTFSLFSRKITGSIDYYIKNSKDLLLNVPVSSTSGFTTALRNIGAIQNKGVELALGAIPINNSNGLTWKVDFNIAVNRNKITALPDGEDIDNGSQIYRVGEPIRTIYIQEWAGVNPADGTPLWYTADDEGNRSGITGNYGEAGEFIVGDATPDFTAGLNNTITFKDFFLSAFFYTAQGHEIYNGSRPFIESDGQRFGWNHSVAALDHWKQPGDISSRPQPLQGGNNAATSLSTRYLEDASFIRLKNIQFGYTLPTDIASKAKLSGIRAYVQGQNLWTITNYSGFDPEGDEDGSEFFRYPLGKSITFGLDITF